jgi:NAD(P)-dependent dehydrogenase (short-subunit alcohol dehydrogenase family)
MTGLDGRVALVTGGSRGIGLAIVERLLAEGCRVASLDLDPPSTRLGSDRVIHLRGDVSSGEDVARAVAEVVVRFGGLHVLVNNAGVNAYFDPVEMTEKDWERFMGVDLKGVWLCSKHAIPEMRRAGGGVIVNIASIHAQMTTAGMFPYAGAKSGVVGLTRSLAIDLGPDHIRVVAVCPGWIATNLVEEALAKDPEPELARRRIVDQHPVRRLGRPEDVAAFVAYLASDDASFITGVPLLIDGGLSARFAS